jgi:hypothetical protein
MKIIPKEELSGLIDIAKGDDDLLAIVRKYIFHGIPYIFNDNQDAYYEFRNRIAKQFNINFGDVFVVGSAKLGYSYHKGTDFTLDSDIDVVIVNTDLFTEFHKTICEYQYKLDKGYRTITKENIERYHKFLEYMAKGWMRPDKLPAQFQLEVIKNEWFDFFKSISYGKSEVGNYKVAGGLYKSYHFLEKYYIESLKSIKNK